MNKEALGDKPETAVEANAATAATQVAANEFEEFGTIEVTGNFRGFWRDVPDRDEEGNARVDEKGNPIVLRKFKITRSVKHNGKVVRQAAWLSEADAKAHGLVDGVKYNLTLVVGETLTPSKTNGGGYVDEYSFTDPTIVSVNSK